MGQVMLLIRTEETGARIQMLMKAQGYTVKDIQDACGFMNPQAVYRWIRGDTLPSVENLLILSRVLKTEIEQLLVVEEQVLMLDEEAERRTEKLQSRHRAEADFGIAC